MGSGLSLLAAMGLGALHSLEPGHGKGIMSAYIVSSKARAFQAMLLGLISALSHALSICILAFITTTTVHSITSEHIIHWIECASACIIIWIGLSRLKSTFQQKIITVRKWNGEHVHTHEHDHHHLHLHSHKKPKNLFQFMTVGFLTGIIPCPSALAIILASMSAHQFIIGLKLVIAFSIGGAFTLAAMGYFISIASKKVNKLDNQKFVKLTNVCSSLCILLLGAVILVSSLKDLIL